MKDKNVKQAMQRRGSNGRRRVNEASKELNMFNVFFI
jgi:hypothetical protein